MTPLKFEYILVEPGPDAMIVTVSFPDYNLLVDYFTDEPLEPQEEPPWRTLVEEATATMLDLDSSRKATLAAYKKLINAMQERIV